jgi:DNA repair photolyase
LDNRNSIKFIQAKTILSKLTHKDTWFGITYNMNLYRGCQHGCIYCDTRSECYGINDISMISIKENAIDLLNKELSSKRKQKGTIGTGSMNDPYMPLEKEINLTRKALEVINKYKYPIHIITKSNLVERDIDIIKDISKTYAAVSLTITTFDDTQTKKIEPFAPLTSLRFKAIEALAKEGIYTGITLMPILPFINDSIENIKSIVHKAKDSGASYIIPTFGLTLRKGSRDYFFTELDRSYTGLRTKYEVYYGENYICSSPNFSKLQEVFENESQRLNIGSKMEFYKASQESQLEMF